MPRSQAGQSADAPALFCSPCIFFTDGACSAGKVLEGEDITTVSDCIHREIPDTTAGEPAQES